MTDKVSVDKADLQRLLDEIKKENIELTMRSMLSYVNLTEALQQTTPPELASFESVTAAFMELKTASIRTQLLQYVPPVGEWPEGANFFAFNGHDLHGMFFGVKPEPI